MDDEQSRREEFLKSEDVFRKNAFLLIDEMVALSATIPDTSMLVDEILHCLFFMGHIIYPPFSVKRLLGNHDDLYEQLKEIYPGSFDCFASKLPKRSPFSCVLDMIVCLYGQEKVKEIKDHLAVVVKMLGDNIQLLREKEKILVSSTLSICKTSSSAIYYGVSMSSFGRNPGRILIAASCLSGYWDDHVADAVMTYYPITTKKSYFDGTFRLPPNVNCQAFTIINGKPINPCRSCGNLFGLETEDKKMWPYGNCAEAESVSRILKNEQEVRVQVMREVNGESRERAKNDVLRELKNLLKQVKFTWDHTYYTPQRGTII